MAIDSVLRQTHDDLEVVVVVDGPHPPTEKLLRSHADPRVRTIVNPSNLGTSGARNVGVVAADGRWIGFLDDDDVWLPAKLTRQLDLLGRSPYGTVASGRIIRRTPQGDFIGPQHPPHEGEHMSEWLFRPRPPLERATRVQPSALLMPRELAIDLPWDAQLPFYEIHDWLLRAAAVGARLTLTEDPVYVWNIHESSISSQNAANWRETLEFIRARRHLVTRRAYAWYILDRVATRAALAPDGPSLAFLVHEARRHGQPSAVDVARCMLRLWTPSGIRQTIRDGLASLRTRRPSR